MKYVLLIVDGCADKKLAVLGDKTPLESLDLPGFNTLAGGVIGLARTVPFGVPAGSDTAILTILGYDVKNNYTGRAALEAAGLGVEVKSGQTALRVNLCSIGNANDINANDNNVSFDDAVMLSHNGFGIEGEDALTLARAVVMDKRFSEAAKGLSFELHPTPTFRHIGVVAASGKPTLAEPHMIIGERAADHMPSGACATELERVIHVSYEILREHPLNLARGDRAANCLWPWAAGSHMSLVPFNEKYGHNGSVITAVPLLSGIANLAGLDAPVVDGATGDIHTNRTAKLDALLASLRTNDFACLHYEAPDECSHALDVEGKRESLRLFDDEVVTPLLRELPKIDADFRILMLSDHLTLCENGAHDGSPVPFAIYDSRVKPKPARFNESEAAQGVYVADGMRLMGLLMQNAECRMQN